MNHQWVAEWALTQKVFDPIWSFGSRLLFVLQFLPEDTSGVDVHNNEGRRPPAVVCLSFTLFRRMCVAFLLQMQTSVTRAGDTFTGACCQHSAQQLHVAADKLKFFLNWVIQSASNFFTNCVKVGSLRKAYVENNKI